MGVAHLDRPNLRPRRLVIGAKRRWETDRVSPQHRFMVQTITTPCSPGLQGDEQWFVTEKGCDMKMRHVTLIVLGIIGLGILAPSPAAAQLQANILSMEWSADGSRFAITTCLGLSIYDSSLNQIAYQSFPDNSEFVVPSIEFNPDGTRIFVGNGTENRILDTTTLASVVDFQNASIQPDTSQWNSDGSEIAFRRGDNRATEIYDATTGNLLRSFSIDSWRNPFSNLENYPEWNIGNEHIIDIVLSPDKTSPRLAASTHVQVELGSPDSFLYPLYGYPFQNDPLIAWRNTVRVIDAPRGTTLASITGLRDAILQLAWSPDGMGLAGVDRYRRLYIWDPNTGDLIDSYLTAPFQVKSLEYSPYGGRLLIVYNALEGSQERPDEFIPISTFAQIQFDGLVQFVAPASSPEKAQSILSQCATDPDIAAAGNSFIASGQYGEFIQWLGQQDESAIPALCADDLQLMAEAISMERSG